MPEYRAVQTEAGVISGRDAIYLDSIRFPNFVTVEFKGSLNSNLCDGLDIADHFVDYTLSFDSIVWFKFVELDFDGVDENYTELSDSESGIDFSESSFDTIENSELIAAFQRADHSSKISSTHRHFVLYTYDVVFELIATEFHLKLGNTRRGTRA